MDREKFKKGLHVSLIIFAGLALAITYFFFIYSNASIGDSINAVILVLRPFIIGAVIAYIMKSTCNFYEKKFSNLFLRSKKADERKSRKRANIVAVILSYITWLLVLAALLWVALPQVIESISNFITDLVSNMPTYIDTAYLWVEKFKLDYPTLAPYIDQAYTFVTGWISNDLAPMLPEIGGNVVQGLIGFVNGAKDVAIGLVVSVFFLSGRKVFAKKSSLFIHCVLKEKHAKAFINEARFADRMFSGFLEGKIIDSTIIGLIYYVALVLMGIEYPALLALICGITNIIPFFGPFIGAVPSGLIILMSHDNPLPKLLYFIIFVCVIQFIDGNIIDPHIVGGNIKISPFCVIFAVIVFGGLWGFVGLIVGVPIFAVIYDIVKKLIYSRLKKIGKAHLVEEFLSDIKKRPKKEALTVPAAPAESSEVPLAQEIVTEPTASEEETSGSADTEAAQVESPTADNTVADGSDNTK